MTTRSIQCGECAARYKIPESFQGKQVKCKACGASIPVDAEDESAADAPVAARPRQPNSAPRESRGGSLRERRAAQTPKQKFNPIKIVLIVVCIGVVVYGYIISNP